MNRPPYLIAARPIVLAAGLCLLAACGSNARLAKAPVPGAQSENQSQNPPPAEPHPDPSAQPGGNPSPTPSQGVKPPRGNETHLDSPFKSSVEGITISNTHVVGRAEGEVLRGMAPSEKISELKKYGITDILIFKDDYNGEVKREVTELQAIGYTPDRIYDKIPFRWRDIPAFQVACEQAIDALALLEKAYRTPGRALYFHCTVGEDRTGVLAGLFRMIEMPQEGWNVRKAFEEEMCQHGYEAGNPQKPEDRVNKLIREELTPLFLKLATLVEDGSIRAGRLDRGVCSQSFESKYDAKDFTCKTSSLYSPTTYSPTTPPKPVTPESTKSSS